MRSRFAKQQQLNQDLFLGRFWVGTSSKGRANQLEKIGESLANRADLSLLKTWIAAQQPSVGTIHHASQAMRGRLELRRNSGRTKF